MRKGERQEPLKRETWLKRREREQQEAKPKTHEEIMASLVVNYDGTPPPAGSTAMPSVAGSTADFSWQKGSRKAEVPLTDKDIATFEE